MAFESISEVRSANRRSGKHFFDKLSMRTWRSRIESELISGAYFVTSEAPGRLPRGFTIREALPSGDVVTVGELRQHATRDEALDALYEHIAEGEVSP